MKKICLILMMAFALLLPAYARPAMDATYLQLRDHMAVRRDVTMPVLRASGTRYIGQVVEWRGMVDTLSVQDGHLAFSLKMGAESAEVRVQHGSFELHAGTPVGVMARITSTGAHPVLDLVAAAPAPQVGLGGFESAAMTLPLHWSGLYPAWQRWILSFNPGLSGQTAGGYVDAIARFARTYRVDPRLVLSVVAAESAFQAGAVSPVGAVGLGQLMPDTGASLGVTNRYNAVENLRGASQLLGQHLQLFGNDLPRVLASYNAGVGAVQQYGGVPPYAETQNYVHYVLSLYRELGGVSR